MRVDQFDFELPEGRIALRPASPRDSAKLLVIPGRDCRGRGCRGRGAFHDKIISDLPNLLNPGDLLVLNDTQVIRAELHGHRLRAGVRAKISLNLLRQDGESWQCLARPAKKLRAGDHILFADALTAEVIAKAEGGFVILKFNLQAEQFDQALESQGVMPLPPYISGKRPADAQDTRDYQTIFASHKGAVAAPTAGLHFTAALFAALEQAGVGHSFLTLHVGAGTFLPVSAEDTKDHKMHSEFGILDQATADRINETKAQGGNIICVGTTALRLVESAAPAPGRVVPFSGETDIFITPGYPFKIADRLITNFHLPRSTLFMLVAAFSGVQRMKQAYAHAIKNNYRFYSYGDACLLDRVT